MRRQVILFLLDILPLFLAFIIPSVFLRFSLPFLCAKFHSRAGLQIRRVTFDTSILFWTSLS
jgi:hypothetical protein